ncbi:MAG TPA: protein kinase, partial [Bryobacteraceae bacterium]
MGIVYQAIDPVVERRVAIKTIDLDLPGAQELVECLKREAKWIGRLEHQNIVTLYDAGQHGQVYYLVLQYVEGETLSRRIGAGLYSTRERLRIMLQLLGALEYAHGCGVVHRDVKPGNVIVAADGQLKLMDFGVAKPIGTSATSSGLVMGTPGYMSPEQILGQAVDGRSDIFSAGCTLVELLTGQLPFRGDGATAVLYNVVHEQPVIGPELTNYGLREIVEKALAKSPGDRFQTCAEFSSALRAQLAKLEKEGTGRSNSLPAVSMEVWRPALLETRKALTDLGSGLSQPGILAATLRVPALFLLCYFTSFRPGPGRTRTVPAAAALERPAAELRVPVKEPAPATPVLPEAVGEPAARTVSTMPHMEPASRPVPRASATVRTVIPTVPPKVSTAVPPAPTDLNRSPSDGGPSLIRGKTLPSRRDDFKSLVVEGDEAFQQGRYDDAFAKYSRAYRINPQVP